MAHIQPTDDQGAPDRRPHPNTGDPLVALPDPAGPPPATLAVTLLVQGRTLHVVADETGLHGDPDAVSRLRRQAEAEGLALDGRTGGQLLDLCHRAFGAPLALHIDELGAEGATDDGADPGDPDEVDPQEAALLRAHLRVLRLRAQVEEAERVERSGPVDGLARARLDKVHLELLQAQGQNEGWLHHLRARRKAERAERAEHELLERIGFHSYAELALMGDAPVPDHTDGVRLDLVAAEAELARLAAKAQAADAGPLRQAVPTAS